MVVIQFTASCHQKENLHFLRLWICSYSFWFKAEVPPLKTCVLIISFLPFLVYTIMHLHWAELTHLGFILKLNPVQLHLMNVNVNNYWKTIVTHHLIISAMKILKLPKHNIIASVTNLCIINMIFLNIFSPVK